MGVLPRRKGRRSRSTERDGSGKPRGRTGVRKKEKKEEKRMKEYKLEFRPLDAPPVIVPSISVEAYLAVGKEQAERMRIRREIESELPDARDVYFRTRDLPKEWLVKKGYSSEWSIPKDRAGEAMAILYPDGTDYPFPRALDMIEGDRFYPITWDD